MFVSLIIQVYSTVLCWRLIGFFFFFDLFDVQVDFIRKEEYYTRNGKQLLEVFFTHQLSRQVRLRKTLKGLYGAGMGWLVPDLGQLA